LLRCWGLSGRALRAFRRFNALFRSSDGQKVWETLEFRQHDSKVSTNPYPMERVISDVTEKAISSLLNGTQHVDAKK